jgi:hypothetical protein
VLFVILKLKSENILEFKGNAFLVNKRGLFLSAGHLFSTPINNCKDYFAAIPSKEKPSQLYKIRKLYHEYFDPTKAESEEEIKRLRLPFYEDLFIGRILKYKGNEHFKLQTRRPKERLNSKCYLRGDIDEFPINNNEVDLSSLYIKTESNPITVRNFSIISKNKTDYEIDPSRVDSFKKYNNCMRLKYSFGPGSSGSPIFDSKGKVVGLHLKGNRNTYWKHILCSKYIRKQYRHINN